MYKYSCRKCPIRNRCIRDSDYSSTIKKMLQSAFEEKTDTLRIWGLLQENCLLMKAEEEEFVKRSMMSQLNSMHGFY